MDSFKDCKYSLRLRRKLHALDTYLNLNYNQINAAISWAKKYHAGQLRATGEPYYSHPLEVAYLVSDHIIKTEVIVGSILHDIVEDTEVTLDMISNKFGSRVAEIVDRLTRDRPDGTKLSVEAILQNAYLAGDLEVILIKLLDRVHNLRTLNAKSKAKIAKTIAYSLNNFSSICLLFNNIELEQTFISCFLDNKIESLNPFVSSHQILFQALENVEPHK